MKFLVIWFLADVIGIIVLVIGGLVIRGWTAKLRKSAIKEPEKAE